MKQTIMSAANSCVGLDKNSLQLGPILVTYVLQRPAGRMEL